MFCAIFVVIVSEESVRQNECLAILNLTYTY